MKPLDGLTIAVTRSEESRGELQSLLEEAGASLLLVPAIRHAPVASPQETERVRRAVLDLASGGAYTHVVFTSPAAVRHFLLAAAREGFGTGALGRAGVAAVGLATARALEEAGIAPGRTGRGGGAALGRELVESGEVGRAARVLLPRSSIARDDLRSALEGGGARVDAVAFYETVAEDPARAEPFLRSIASGRPPAAITFTSPSTLEGFLEITGERGRRALGEGGVRIATIGPATSEAARAEGLDVAAEAHEPTATGLVRAVIAAVGRRGAGPG